jgi:hypothetical protein
MSRLSSRADPFLAERPALEYSRRQVAGLAHQYAPSLTLDEAPDSAAGPSARDRVSYVLLAVAENKQSTLQQMLLNKMRSFAGYDAEALNYTDPSGLPRCKAAMASFLSRYVFDGNLVQASDLIIAPGNGWFSLSK